MNPTAYDMALIAGGFGIVGALLGAWVTYRLSMKLVQRTYENSINLMKRQDFNKAATELRNAFLPEITFLKHNANIGDLGSSNDLDELLQFAYIHRHLRAIETFKPHLSLIEREGIDKAWKEFCGHKDEGPVEGPSFQQYSYKFNERETIGEQRRQLALDRIEKIIEFSKHR